MRGNLGLFVSSADRARLAAIVADRNSRQKHAQRAHVVLLTGERLGTAEIMRRTGLSKPSVWRWQQRYVEAGVDGLLRDKTRPSRIPRLAEEKVAAVVRLTLEEPPPADATRWTVRAMAEKSGVSTAMVHRIWQKKLALRRLRQRRPSRRDDLHHHSHRHPQRPRSRSLSPRHPRPHRRSPHQPDRRTAAMAMAPNRPGAGVNAKSRVNDRALTIEPSRRRLLYQLTQFIAATSTAAKLRQGP